MKNTLSVFEEQFLNLPTERQVTVLEQLRFTLDQQTKEDIERKKILADGKPLQRDPTFADSRYAEMRARFEQEKAQTEKMYEMNRNMAIEELARLRAESGK